MTTIALAAVFISIMLAVETRRSMKQAEALLAAGGIEPDDDVYGWLRFAYPVAFAGMFVEGAVRGGPGAPWMTAVGVGVLVAAKTLKWWAILTLGPRWSFRVVVLPGRRLVTGGPYRYLRHPNYWGVAGELVGLALLTGARVAGPAGTAICLALIWRRKAVEERAQSQILNRATI
jgi:methyltransferase